jgi:arginase
MGRGPAKLFATGIVEALERSGANVRVAEVALPDDRFVSEISSAFALQAIVAERVAKAKREGSLPIVLSGNCNTAVGTVAGLTSGTGPAPTVVWLDAHADFNTPESTTSGFLDGMAVGMLAGRCWTPMTSRIRDFTPVDEGRIVMIGVRDVDPLEADKLDDSGVRRLPADFTKRELRSALARSSHVYLHIDLDVFDPTAGVANEYAAADGLTRERFMILAAYLGRESSVDAAALTAYDPSFDPDNRIARLAIDIAVTLATGSGISGKQSSRRRGIRDMT